MIVAAQKGVEAMKTARETIRRMVAENGRDPDSCKVLFQIAPVLGDTQEEAEEKKRRRDAPTDERTLMILGLLAGVTEIDFTQFDLDAPLPKVTTEGHRGMLDEFLKMADGRTLRQVASEWTFSSVELVGPAERLAAQMRDIMEDVGGDGYLVVQQPDRNYLVEITEDLAPALQRLGVARREYSYPHFRDNLLEY
jgi:alkanesulfonate monooxygenase SsuD/methylene tetrahydromethanopterin reductase-like flavin-dependent oxidoreductase (luciferase family)